MKANKCFITQKDIEPSCIKPLDSSSPNLHSTAIFTRNHSSPNLHSTAIFTRNHPIQNISYLHL